MSEFYLLNEDLSEGMEEEEEPSTTVPSADSAATASQGSEPHDSRQTVRSGGHLSDLQRGWYEDRIQELEKEIEDIKSTIEQCEKDIETFARELEKTIGERDNLSKERECLEEALSLADDETERTASANQDLQKDVDEKKERIAELELRSKGFAELHNRELDASTKLYQKIEDFEKLKSEHEKVKKEKEELERERDELKNRIDELGQQIYTKTQLLVQQKQQYQSTIEFVRRDETEGLKKFDRELKEQEEMNEQQSKDLQDRQTQMQKLEDKIRDSTKQHDMETSQSEKNYADEIAQMEAEIARLKLQADEKDRNYQKGLEDRNADFENKLEARTTEIARLREENETLREICKAGHDKDIRDIASERDNAATEDLDKKLEEQRKASAGHVAQLEEKYSAKITTLEAERAAAVRSKEDASKGLKQEHYAKMEGLKARHDAALRTLESKLAEEKADAKKHVESLKASHSAEIEILNAQSEEKRQIIIEERKNDQQKHDERSASFRNEIARLQKLFKDSVLERDVAVKERDAGAQKLSEAEEEVVKNQAAAAAHEGELEILEEQIKTLEQNAATHDDEIDTLQEKLGEETEARATEEQLSRAEIAHLEKVIQEKEERVIAADAAHRQELADLRKEFTQSTSYASEQQQMDSRRLDELREEASRRESALIKSHQEILQDLRSTLESRLRNKDHEIRDLLSQLETQQLAHEKQLRQYISDAEWKALLDRREREAARRAKEKEERARTLRRGSSVVRRASSLLRRLSLKRREHEERERGRRTTIGRTGNSIKRSASRAVRRMSTSTHTGRRRGSNTAPMDGPQRQNTASTAGTVHAVPLEHVGAPPRPPPTGLVQAGLRRLAGSGLGAVGRIWRR